MDKNINLPPSLPSADTPQPNREKRREKMNNFVGRFNSEGWVSSEFGCFCNDCWIKFCDHPKTKKLFGEERPPSSGMDAFSAKHNFQSANGYYAKCTGVEGEEKCQKEISENF